MRRKASSPWGQGLPAGAPLWRRGLASGGWRGGQRDAGEGGTSLWMTDRSSGNHLRRRRSNESRADPGLRTTEARSADPSSLDSQQFWLHPSLLPVLVDRLWTDCVFLRPEEEPVGASFFSGELWWTCCVKDVSLSSSRLR